jgi:hypothetical protein
MAPLANQVHVDSLLSNISIKYQPTDFIAMQVFPEVQVKKTSDLYRVYDRNFRIPETKRANRAEAREHSFEVSTASYLLDRHSLKDFVSDTDQGNYDLADLRAETTEELTNVILRRLELQVAQLFTSTNWSLNVSLASTLQFDDNTTISNPIQVFQTAASTIIANAGFKPNFGILPRDGFVACVNHISIADRLKYTSAEIDARKLAALFDLGQLLIPAASYDSSAPGVADTTTNIVPFYGDNAFVGFKPSAPGPMKPSSGYIFRNVMPMVKRWRVEERESECIEVNMEFQAKVVASLSGYLIKDILS